MLAISAGSAGAVEEVEVSADAGVLTPPPLPVPEPVRPPPEPRWARVGGSVGVIGSGWRFHSLGLEASLLGTVLGTPAPSADAPGEVEGWVLAAGAEGGWARAGGPICGDAFCGTRISGGLGAKGGWARGLPNARDGVTRLHTVYFAQLDVLLSYFSTPAAPLSPPIRVWELLTRLRLGVHLTTERSRLSSSTGFTFLVAAIVEAIPVSAETRSVSVGLTAGLGI